MATDFNKLRLKYHDDAEMLDSILQEECRVKCARKLPLTLVNSRFRFPSLALAEMCTSDAVAAIHAQLVGPGNSVLDMTAGLGVDSFAFASSGCQVTAVELDAKAACCLRENAEALNLNDSVTIVNADSLDWLSESREQFDVIFVDPARRDTGGRHISLRNCLPDITGRIGDLLTHAGKIVVKTSPMIDISAAVKEFGTIPSRVTVIGTTRECKEVVFTFTREHDAERMSVECVTVGHGVYEYRKSEPFYADPTPGKVLMQPFPAVMKGTGGNVSGYAKIHPMTHLYVSDTVEPDFPGVSYSIIEVLDFNKRVLKELKTRLPLVNVAVRNFPIPAPELVRKLGIKEGGDETLFAVTLLDGRRVLILSGRLPSPAI